MPERKSLLYKLKNERVDVNQAIQVSSGILDNYCSYFESFYLHSEYCIMGSDFYSAYHSLINDDDNSVDAFLDYCDLVFTVLFKYNGSHVRDYAIQIIKILSNALNQLGYDVKKTDNNTVDCYRKDLKAELVASKQEVSTKDKIYHYLSIRDGNVEDKRRVLKSLIDDVEIVCKTKSSIADINKTKQFYQCVRHTKDDPKKEFPFYYQDEEKWLDFIFQMVIDVLAFKDLSARVKTIVEEENKLLGEKK